jgi:hypothetical protein
MGLVEGRIPECNYWINGHQYIKVYYLGDDIYLKWSNKSYFPSQQKSCRKDVVRAFGVLQDYCAIIKYLAHTLSLYRMWEVMNAFVIMHNMLVERERDVGVVFDEPYDYQSLVAKPHQVSADFDQFLDMHKKKS